MSDETERAAAEAGRVEAEMGRVVAEEGPVPPGRRPASRRGAAESGRVGAETGRVEAETGRADAASLRVEAETERVDAEAERGHAEDDRGAAEHGRDDAEGRREQAEVDRATAEELRVTASGIVSNLGTLAEQNIGARRLGRWVLVALTAVALALVVGAVLGWLVFRGQSDVADKAELIDGRSARIESQAAQNAGLTQQVIDSLAAIRDCQVETGECYQRNQALLRSAIDEIVQAVNDARGRLTELGHDNQRLRDAQAALLAEIVLLRTQLDYALNRPLPPNPSPPTTLAPPSSGLCSLLGPLGSVLGC